MGEQDLLAMFGDSAPAAVVAWFAHRLVVTIDAQIGALRGEMQILAAALEKDRDRFFGALERDRNGPDLR